MLHNIWSLYVWLYTILYISDGTKYITVKQVSVSSDLTRFIKSFGIVYYRLTLSSISQQNANADKSWHFENFIALILFYWNLCLKVSGNPVIYTHRNVYELRSCNSILSSTIESNTFVQISIIHLEWATRARLFLIDHLDSILRTEEMIESRWSIAMKKRGTLRHFGIEVTGTSVKLYSKDGHKYEARASSNAYVHKNGLVGSCRAWICEPKFNALTFCTRGCGHLSAATSQSM